MRSLLILGFFLLFPSTALAADLGLGDNVSIGDNVIIDNSNNGWGGLDVKFSDELGRFHIANLAEFDHSELSWVTTTLSLDDIRQGSSTLGLPLVDGTAILSSIVHNELNAGLVEQVYFSFDRPDGLGSITVEQERTTASIYRWGDTQRFKSAVGNRNWDPYCGESPPGYHFTDGLPDGDGSFYHTQVENFAGPFLGGYTFLDEVWEPYSGQVDGLEFGDPNTTCAVADLGNNQSTDNQLVTTAIPEPVSIIAFLPLGLLLVGTKRDT